MRKFLLAALMTALIVALTVCPAFAAEVEGVTAEETAEENAEETAEETTEEATEEQSSVDGAIVQDDYVTRMIEGGKDWVMDNPETIGSAACSGIMLAAAAWLSKVSKKERKAGEKREKEFSEKASVLNNNAVEIAETAKAIAEEGKAGIIGATANVLSGFKDLAQEIVTELRANRMETRANSLLLAEMIKDARLPEKRKDEILSVYRNARGEEAEADVDADET